MDLMSVLRLWFLKVLIFIISLMANCSPGPKKNTQDYSSVDKVAKDNISNIDMNEKELQPLRQKDAFLYRLIGVSADKEHRPDLLDDFEWRIDLFAKNEAYYLIKIDTDRDGDWEEEWEEENERVIRKVLDSMGAVTNKYIYSEKGWILIE